MQYFSLTDQSGSFSKFFRDNKENMSSQIKTLVSSSFSEIRFIAYCLMPTHFHFAIQQKRMNSISHFMAKLQNSYTRYFNTKHKRKGPLWESQFQHVECETDEQILHLTRYIHLNPVTAYLVEKPEDWIASSYQEFINPNEEGICQIEPLIQISSPEYKKFVLARIHDQRMLAMIKKDLFEKPCPTSEVGHG